ncbi:hypothetical protein ACHWQZ_G006796 [Mnemiopsis leidyi]
MVQYAIFSQNKSCFQSAGCFYSSFCCYNINTQCHDNMVSSCSRNEAGLTSCLNLTNCQKKFDNVCCKDSTYCCDYECCMKKKWVFWLVFSVVVTVLVFTVFVLLLKGIRRSRRVDEVVSIPPATNNHVITKQSNKLFNNIDRRCEGVYRNTAF